MTARRRTEGWITLCATLGVLSGGCDSETRERNARLSNIRYRQARDYFDNKQADAAKTELVQVLELDPNNADAHELIGVIFFLEGIHAVNFMKRHHCLKGAAAEEQAEAANDRFHRAETHFRRVIELLPEGEQLNPDVLNYLANVALHFKRYDEAIGLMDQGLESIVYGFQHYLLGTRGLAYLEKGDLTAAARDLRQALFHQPRFCVGRYRLAKVYVEQKTYKEALDELDQIADDTACPIQEANELRGLAAMRQRRTAPAREAFDRCIAVNPKSCVAEACARYAKLL